MTHEQVALARRAVACKGWKWMPGMATYTPVPYTSPHLGRIVSGEDDIFHLWRDETIPRLRDPATRGCLLTLVREAHACPYLQVSVSISREHGYRFEANPHHRGAWVDSEEEALVAALEAAP